MSENVTPDICTKKAISTNQVAPLEKINGILLEKVQSQIYSSCRLHSLIALHIALLPLLLGEQVFCFFSPPFWPQSKNRVGASRRQISNVCLGLKWDCAQTLRVILASGKTARPGPKVCINIKAKHNISEPFTGPDCTGCR